MHLKFDDWRLRDRADLQSKLSFSFFLKFCDKSGAGLGDIKTIVSNNQHTSEKHVAQSSIMDSKMIKERKK